MIPVTFHRDIDEHFQKGDVYECLMWIFSWGRDEDLYLIDYIGNARTNLDTDHIKYTSPNYDKEKHEQGLYRWCRPSEVDLRGLSCPLSLNTRNAVPANPIDNKYKEETHVN